MRKFTKILSLIMASALMMTSVDVKSVSAEETDSESIGDLIEETLDLVGDLTDTIQSASGQSETEDTKADASTEQDDSETSETAWTVYMYMIGGESESEYGLASDNIEEILEGTKTEDVQFIIQAGGAKEWQTDEKKFETDPDKTQRFLIKNGEISCVYEDTLKDMAQTSTLSDFAEWGVENYPSDRSMFIFYGDGKGVKGLAEDEIFEDTLKVSDISTALNEAGAHYDILAFDACYMADLDVLCNVSDFADYLIASENIISENGFDYNALVDTVSKNPGCSPLNLATKICDAYFESCRSDSCSYETLSVIDSSKMEDVRAAAADYVKALCDMYSNDQESLAILFSGMAGLYDYNINWERDLETLVENSADYLTVDEVEALTDEIADSVKEAVCYKVCGENTRHNNGISFAYAFGFNYVEMEAYQHIAMIPQYVALLDALKYNFHPEKSLYDSTEKLTEAERKYFTKKLELTESKNNFDDLKVSEGLGNLYSIDYEITKTDDVGRKFSIQERSDLSAIDDNSYATEFDGNVVTIDGIPIVLMIEAESEEGTYYNVPVSVMNEDGEFEDRSMYVYYDRDWTADTEKTADKKSEKSEETEYTYTILGLQKQNHRQKKNSTYDVESIDDGTVMRAAYSESGREAYLYGDEFTYTEDTEISMAPLEDGEYDLTYFIIDGFGNRTESDSQTFYMADGEISMTDPEADESNEDGTLDNSDADNTEEEEDLTLNIVSYKKYYGTEVPERLKDKHYEMETQETETKDSDLEGIESAQAKTEAANSDASDEENETDKSSVTMLCYVCGSDLENTPGAGSDILRRATKADLGENVNILFETGGAASWHLKGLDTESIQRFEARDGKLVEVSNVPIYNMSTGDAFAEFLEWGVTNYPAEHYVLYVFDHGGAWLGTCWDRAFGSSNITLDDWTYALASSGVTFDDVIFDECLMSCVEVAAAIAPYAKYMTGYEESQMSLPYEWERIFNYISRHADNFNPEMFGKNVIDMNADVWEDKGVYFQTQSLTDLSKVPALVTALDEYAKELSGILDEPEALTRTVKGIEKARSYSYAFQKDIVEMMDYSEGISSKTRQNVVNAVNDAVIYKRSSYDQLRNNGMTMFFNLNNTFSYYDRYASVCPMSEYVKFLDAAITGWHEDSNVFTEDEKADNTDILSYRPEFELIDENENGMSGIRILSGEDAIIEKSYKILKYDEEQNRYYQLAERNDFAEGDDNEYYEQFDGRVVSIDGVRCLLKYVSADKNRVLYNIPVTGAGGDFNINVAFYPDDGDTSNVTDLEKGHFEILGASSSIAVLDAGVPEKNIQIAQEGDELTILFPEVSEKGDTLYNIKGDTITYSKDLKIGFTSLEDGDYILRYCIKNGLEETETSEDVIITVNNARVKPAEISEDEE